MIALQRGLSLAVFLLLSLAPASGCNSSFEMYHSRGRVREIDPGPPRRLVIEHEAIPNFKDREGKASTMPSMKMAFDLSLDVARVKVKVGDPVAILFRVRYDQGGRLVLHGVTHLKEGTELRLAGGQEALGHKGAEGQQGAHE